MGLVVERRCCQVHRLAYGSEVEHRPYSPSFKPPKEGGYLEKKIEVRVEFCLSVTGRTETWTIWSWKRHDL